MPRAFTIPVAFVVVSQETEEEAAKHLVRILAAHDLVSGETDHPNYPIDSWWTPNHPEADGSDGESGPLIWANPLKDFVQEEADEDQHMSGMGERILRYIKTLI